MRANRCSLAPKAAAMGTKRVDAPQTAGRAVLDGPGRDVGGLTTQI